MKCQTFIKALHYWQRGEAGRIVGTSAQNHLRASFERIAKARNRSPEKSAS